MEAKQFASTYGQFAQDLPESRVKDVRKISVVERLHVGLLMQWAQAIWSRAGDCCHQQSIVSLVSENRLYFVTLNLRLMAKENRNICSSVLLSCSCLNLTVAVRDCLPWILCHTTNCASTTKFISPQCICYSGHFINCIWCLCTVVYAFHVPVFGTSVYSSDTFANESWAFCCMCMCFCVSCEWLCRFTSVF